LVDTINVAHLQRCHDILEEWLRDLHQGCHVHGCEQLATQHCRIIRPCMIAHVHTPSCSEPAHHDADRRHHLIKDDQSTKRSNTVINPSGSARVLDTKPSCPSCTKARPCPAEHQNEGNNRIASILPSDVVTDTSERRHVPPPDSWHQRKRKTAQKDPLFILTSIRRSLPIHHTTGVSRPLLVVHHG